MRLIHCTSLVEGTSALKNVDPLDYKGDGSAIPLEVNDRAIVSEVSGSIAFYILKEAAAQSDNGILLVVPSVNAGDLYWSCCGFTKDSLQAPSGTIYDVFDGSRIPPEGFAGSVIPYSELPFSGWDVWYNGVEMSYYGCALVNNILYVVDASDLHVWDLTSESYSLEATNNTDDMWNTTSHCLENPENGSDNIISDFVEVDHLSRFKIAEREAAHIPFVFISPATNWTDIFGEEGVPWMGVRHGKWHYWTLDNAVSTGFCRVDVTTGEVYKLANMPFAADDGCIVPDFETGQIYYINAGGNSETMRYTPGTDSWGTLAPHSGDLWWMHMSWVDSKNKQIIVPGLDNITNIYDILTDTWESHSHTESVTEGGLPLYYKGLGMICPFGYENPNGALTHFIIKEENPFRIIKS